MATPYGPMPGCPDCGIIKLHGEPHLCDHGVTPAPDVQVAFAFTVAVDTENFLKLMYGDAHG